MLVYLKVLYTRLLALAFRHSTDTSVCLFPKTRTISQSSFLSTHMITIYLPSGVAPTILNLSLFGDSSLSMLWVLLQRHNGEIDNLQKQCTKTPLDIEKLP